MVNFDSHDLNRVFHALADPTRREIIGALALRGRTVGEISRPFDISMPAVSKHLKVLEKAGLIRREIKGREHHCSLNPETLAHAHDWIAYYKRFWESRLDALEDLLREQDPNT